MCMATRPSTCRILERSLNVERHFESDPCQKILRLRFFVRNCIVYNCQKLREIDRGGQDISLSRLTRSDHSLIDLEGFEEQPFFPRSQPPASFTTSHSPLPLPASKRQRTLDSHTATTAAAASKSGGGPSPSTQKSVPVQQEASAGLATPLTTEQDNITYEIAQSDSDSTMDELSNSSSASYANSWISWFLASKGNEYFCEVDDEYIIDRFNLTGLNAEVSGYSGALELITDTTQDDDLNEEQRDQLETSARHLYGLIHARFIITSRGLAKMIEKYKRGDFGRCPRVLCYGQALLPLGLSDLAYQKAVKLYCPRCEDLYSPKSSRHASIDGAYFGSTFSHMLFMVYPAMIPSKSVPGGGVVGVSATTSNGPGGLGSGAAGKVERVRPRIFGFRVHESAKLQRWQEKLRDDQIARLEKIERDAALD